VGVERVMGVRVSVGVAKVVGRLADWPMRACSVVGGKGSCMAVELVGVIVWCCRCRLVIPVKKEEKVVVERVDLELVGTNSR